MSTETIFSSENIAEFQKPQEAETVFYPERNQKVLAQDDFRDGLRKWRIWMMLSYQDIRLRYRRSVLGPLWLTLSMAITVYSMGYLYGHLFHTNLETYFPFLVGGMISWALISSSITELGDAYAAEEGLIKQIKLPYTLYIHRVISRNIIIFLHTLLVIIPILIIFHQVAKVNLNSLLLVPNLIIFYVNAFTYGILLSMVGARYRDLSQIIKSLVQVIFFVTPVMWNPSLLPQKDHYLVYLNPFYAFVELIRAPLLGQAPEAVIYLMCALVTGLGIFLCKGMFSRYRARIVYWI
jgi:lipopolysaccharide transport system permease protein